MNDPDNPLDKAEHLLWAQTCTKELCDKTLDFILEEIRKNKYNDTIYFSAVKALHNYVRAIMVKTHGEHAVRKQEAAIITVDPTTDWKE